MSEQSSTELTPAQRFELDIITEAAESDLKTAREVAQEQYLAGEITIGQADAARLVLFSI